jgi:peptidylprolyl isomerase
MVAALALTGCDDGGADEPVADEDAAAEPADDGVTPDTAEAPDPAAALDPDRGDPPDELVVEDIVEGDGDVLEPGMFVSVEYVGVTWSTGEEFDSSWGSSQTFDFELGDGRVIPGWEQGIEGMRVGGRRMLTIPPDLAYGERGAGEAIGPDETLVFVVDAIEAEPAPTFENS